MNDDDGTETGADGSTDHEETELREAVATFLAAADDVYDEYDKGYVDADAALSVLSGDIATLRAAADEE